MPTALEVVETGDRLVYRVRSEANPRNFYRVDLLANDGRGECMCKWWATHCWPIIRDGGVSWCKHGDACRSHFLNQLLPEMARRERRPSTVHRQPR